jgi:hypothetical protein
LAAVRIKHAFDEGLKKISRADEPLLDASLVGVLPQQCYTAGSDYS